MLGDRLLAVGGHRRDDQPQVLLRVAEGQLLGAQRLDPRRPRLAVGEVVDVDDRALVPLAVGLAAGDPPLDLLVLDDPALLEVEQEQLARGEPALALDVLRGDGHHPGLRGQHDVALGVLDPAAGAQAVAVEHGAGHPAVGEHDRRRAVPRLHQAGVEVVEALDVGVEVLAGPVGLGDHHHHRVRDRAAARARAARARCRRPPSQSRRSRTTGMTFSRSSPNSSEASCDSRARIQLMFPRSVLTSPLWAIIR